MSKKARKHIWPVSLAMSLALVGVLAVVALALAGSNTAQAHGPCDLNTMTVAEFAECVATGGDDTHNHDGNGGNGVTDTGAMLKSSSSTGSAGVKLTLTIELDENLNSGSWVELYLENDYQEPGDISTADVIFSATGGTPSTAGTPSSTTGDGGTFDAAAVEIDDGGKIGTEEDVVVISAKIPDMDPRDDYYGYPGDGQTLTMVVRTSAGIKNPSEQGMHSTGYAIIVRLRRRPGR